VINQRNISGVLLIFSFAIYLIFGKAGDTSDMILKDAHIIELWDSYYFMNLNLLVIYLSILGLKCYRDKLSRIIVKVFLGVAIGKLLLNLYSFMDMNSFDKINTSSEAGAIIVSCIVVFLIYRSNGMVKRKV
jgi:heme/copper-type cytochrome/quinol oxidase subunit 4